MKVLTYHRLDTSRVKVQYHKLITQLERDDFYSADVKKLKNTPYYRAKLDAENRLLFQVVTYQGKSYIVALEIILNHKYEKSRFLKGASVDESKFTVPKDRLLEPELSLPYLNSNKKTLHLLDKIISFDPVQDEIYDLPLPLIIIGSAGSGKTMLTLEKIKDCVGDILYVTHSSYLVENARNLYYANGFSNDHQELDFLSYQEYLETIKVPPGEIVDAKRFSMWLSRVNRSKLFRDANKLLEEFKGVLTGSIIDKPCLSRADYKKLGIKQSIFQLEERDTVYDLFEKYLAWLKESNLADSNLVSYDYLRLSDAKYDVVIVDEIQDFTIIQLHLILGALRDKQQFLLCGDSNQIVHPNFFSWSKIKTLFYQAWAEHSTQVMRILTKNYRNSPEITAIANRLLKIKNKRFGSVDRESHYLVDSHAAHQGEAHYLSHTDAVIQELNNKTKQSTQYAVVVINDEYKDLAKQHFQTPLIFSVQEAKGLEYENVILYNFIASHDKKYAEICQGVSPMDLDADLNYARVKDKSDRSMEVYKFYINALYVAVTRAVKNIYIVEDLRKHPLLNLLGTDGLQDSFTMEIKKSSIEEWQKEAHRLELQGKQEQATEIRQLILKTKTVPWTVLSLELLAALKERVFSQQQKDKAATILLLEYAILYSQHDLIKRLSSIGVKAANHLNKASEMLKTKHFQFYTSTNIRLVMCQADTYGVDFRNPFNQTPLMVASHYGNEGLVSALIDKGAKLSLVDNAGRTAFHLALNNAYIDKQYANKKLAAVYSYLSPTSTGIKVGNKLIKIDAHTMECFLLNLIMAIFSHKLVSRRRYWDFRGFSTGDLLAPLSAFPNQVLLERRQKRSYLSSILSKNELSREGPYNRQLFLRVERGHYILNPDLEVKVDDVWVNIYKHLHSLPMLKQHCSVSIKKHFPADVVASQLTET